MAYVCCFAATDRASVPTFESVFATAKPQGRATFARLDVAELGRLAPDLLVCDVDEVEVDPLELLRRIRFVLPECTIAVYTARTERVWGVACHLAGVNCMLAKASPEPALCRGLRFAMESGCYTDPRFSEKTDRTKTLPI